MVDVHVISHTHWDREWYLTREQFRLRLVALVDRLLDLLDEDPRFEHFHLDGQTIVLEDYLEMRPGQEKRLRKAIRDGRVLVGPWYDMPDEFLVSGEALVRNLALGHRIARDYGTPMPVGYLPDLFGHVSQMPQILRHFGLDNAILWRGFDGPNAEYRWSAPDGSRVLMMHLPPEGYCNATRLVFDPSTMRTRALEKVTFERDRTRTGQVLLMNGVDHVEPHPAIPRLVRDLSNERGIRARHSTLPRYVAAVRAAVRKNGRLEQVFGELRSGEEYASLLPGVLSTRTYLKQENARVQTRLEREAEPLSTLAMLTGLAYAADQLRYAWKTLIQNHPHDSICGCSIDEVHDENMTRFARAGQVADALADRAIGAICREVEAPPPSHVRSVVFNTDGHSIAEVVETVIDLPYDTAEPGRTVDAQALDFPVIFFPRDAHPIRMTDPDGDEVPFQILSDEDVITLVMSRYETPWLLHARRFRLVWLADAVPPLGYASYDVQIGLRDPGPGPQNDRRIGLRAAGDGPQNARQIGPRAPGPGPQNDRRIALRAAGDGPQNARQIGPRQSVDTSHQSAENGRLRIHVNADGTLDITDKASGFVWSRCAAFEDVGDVGDEYNYSPPDGNRRVTSVDTRNVRVAMIHSGPVRTELRIDLDLAVPACASPDRKTRVGETTIGVSMRVTLDAGSSRVGLHVSVDNTAKDHRLRIQFPTGASSVATARADTAFDIIERPARRAVPARVHREMPVSSAPMASFVDAGDEGRGLTVTTRGLVEYEICAPNEGEQPNTIAVTLLRSVGDLSREDLTTRPAGHAGPGLATPGAQCLGRHEFDLAIEPRTSRPADWELFDRARSFVAPPRVGTIASSDGTLPRTQSFIHIDGPAVLSACKRADDRDSIVVRLFNPSDRPVAARIATAAPLKRAFLVDFLEQRRKAIKLENGSAPIALGPHRIETIELVVGRRPQMRSKNVGGPPNKTRAALT